MGLSEDLVNLHNEIIQNQPRYGYNFESNEFEEDPRYLSLVEKYGIWDREWSDSRQCGPDTWEIWTFWVNDDEGCGVETHIKIKGESIMDNEYTVWESAYEVFPVEVTVIEWKRK